MSVANIRAALELRLAALSPALRIAYENVSFTPTAGEPYQRAFMLPATTQNPAFGSTLKHESGLFQINLMYPANKGSGDAYARAELIRSHFPRGLTLTQSGTTVIIQRTPSISPAAVDGDRYVVPVTIPYFAHLF